MPSNLQRDVLARAMRDAPIGMCVVAPDGRILTGNAALCEFFGLSVEELTASTWQELTHPEDLAIDAPQVQRLLDGRADSYRLTKRYTHSGGTTVVGDLAVSAIRDDSGAVDYFVSQIVDITARSRAEEALDASQEQFRVMFQHATDIVTIMAPDGEVEWISPSVTGALGWTGDDAMPSNVVNFIHPDDLPDVEAATQLVATGGAATRIRHRLLRADGSARWFETALTAESVANGKPRRIYGTSRDVHDEVLAQTGLEHSQALLRGVLDSLPDPWVLLDPVRDDDDRIVDFVYVDANEEACRFNRRTREDLIGSRLLDLLPDHGPSGLLDAYAAVIYTGVPLALDDDPFPDPHIPGGIGRFDNRAVRIGDQLSFTWRDVTDRYEARRRLADLAHHDDLTGLANRARFNERLKSVFSRTPRTGSAIALLFCDLDDFKPINDDYGHAVGDIVLRELAARIASSVRAQDTIARVGGDEFVAILEGVRSADDAVQVAEKVRAAVAEPITVGDHILSTTISIGVALAEPNDDPAETLERADVALYQAKSRGGNYSVLFELAAADR